MKIEQNKVELKTVEIEKPKLRAREYVIDVKVALMCFAMMALSMAAVATSLIVNVNLVQKVEQFQQPLIIYEVSSERIVFLKVLALKPKTDYELARRIAKVVDEAAKDFHRDPDFILAMAATESNFNPEAVSSAGAVGLLQVMPFWLKVFGAEGEDLRSLRTNVRRGIQIYSACEQIYAHKQVLALTAYNRGSWRVEEDLRRGADPRNGYAKSVLDEYEKLKNMR